jgi:hypothetical protein
MWAWFIQLNQTANSKHKYTRKHMQVAITINIKLDHSAGIGSATVTVIIIFA